ncbi:hydrolase [Sphingomicrobium marinum]|uniref:hydrolase n=1 Tax=Sphingomicrobium marinum TaxID=1227950 RepID=UPI00223F0387|nr:hydrolase [Sphingomicrobium marinum]
MGSLSSQEQAAVERAMAAQDTMFDRTREWAAINSGSRNLEGLAKVGEKLMEAVASLPCDATYRDPARVEAVDAAGKTFDIEHGRHIHVQVRPDAPLRLLFTGHMDTVFGVDHPFQEMKWLEEGKVLNGPGITDMKGGIAVMLAALEAVEASEDAAKFGYDIVFNADEEVGSLSSAPLLAEAAAGKRAALTYEPSALPDGTLAGARSGSGNFSFIISGKSAHAGRNPQEGRNALVAAADLAMRLKAGMDDSLSVNPAKIDGGGPNNVVPDHAVLRVNFRPKLPADQDRAEKLIADAQQAVAREHDVDIHRHGAFARPPKPLEGDTKKLFELVQRAGADLGQDIGWKHTGGVCDGNNIAATGVPVVDTMGVRGGAIHSSDEFLIVDSLGERAALSALTILRIINS